MMDLPITKHLKANDDSANRSHKSRCETAVFEVRGDQSRSRSGVE